jgi:hypothetical protein
MDFFLGNNKSMSQMSKMRHFVRRILIILQVESCDPQKLVVISRAPRGPIFRETRRMKDPEMYMQHLLARSDTRFLVNIHSLRHRSHGPVDF